VRRFGLILVWGFSAILLIVALVLGGGYLYLRGSLPPLDGTRSAEGLEAELRIERDSLGVPVIEAESLGDVVYGQGFVHGQDRFLQMDLLRRLMAGRLSELVGVPGLPSDRENRAYGWMEAAELHLENLDPDDRRLLDRYVEGVNAGLASLGRRRPEYLVSRSTPEPWRPVDSILAYLYFYPALSEHYRTERHLRTLYAVLPTPVADFLTPDASRFDAPVLVDDDISGGYTPLPIPETVEVGAARVGLVETPLPFGSNAWALRDEEGRTIVANDPHLGLSIPGVWYRVELRWENRRVVGVSPPGLPGVFAGMSEDLAWGVTAAIVDQTDLVELEIDPEDASRYQVAGGWDTIQVHTELVRVRGSADETVEVRRSRWGPILFEGHDGVPLALRSPAYDEGGVTLRVLATLQARTLEDMVELIHDLGGPGLSIVVADRDGRIGWGVAGVLPERIGFSGKRPVSFTPPWVGWTGVRDRSERPMVILDEAGAFHTANQRLLSMPESRALSYRWMPPYRALRIAESIPDAPLTVDWHHDFQLDTRSLLHDPIRDIALEVLADADEPILDTLRIHLEAWDGTADPDTPYFRSMVRVGSRLMDAVLSPLLEPVHAADPRFVYRWELSHEPALRILEERPPHLLPEGFEGWDDFLRAHLLAVARRLSDEGFEVTWGEVNRARIHHPFGQVAPVLGRFLNLPSDPLAGWSGTVRAQTPSYGQSFRFVGIPGDFESATFQMPAGQSGNPFSRYYRAGHDAWLEGAQVPLTAGPPRHTLVLIPPS